MDVELTAWAHGADDWRVYVDPRVLGAQDGDLAELASAGGARRNLYFRISAKPLTGAVSVSSAVLQRLGIRSRQPVRVRALAGPGDRRRIQLDVVELKYKGVLLTRNDHYKIAKSLTGACVCSGQRVAYLDDHVRLHIDTLYRNGTKKFSGYIGADTRLVFRSDSARVLIFIQLSAEMWNFDETGDIMFHRLVNSFLPEMLRRWHDQGDSHLVSIILFTSVASQTERLAPGILPPQAQNFYRVVVDAVHIARWSDIMQTLRYEFTRFPREVLVTSAGAIRGEFLPANKGNLLEAVALATTLLTSKFADRDLWRSGVQALFATAGPACFDVDLAELYTLSRQLLGVEIGIELVCLARPPLHVAPLFRSLVSKMRPRPVFCVPTWINISFWTPNKFLKQWIPQCRIYDLQMVGLIENQRAPLGLKFDVKQNFETEYMKAYDAKVFVNDEAQDLRPRVDGLVPMATTATTYLVATHAPQSPTSPASTVRSPVVRAQPPPAFVPLILGQSVIPPPALSSTSSSQAGSRRSSVQGTAQGSSQPSLRLQTPALASARESPDLDHSPEPERTTNVVRTRAFKVERKEPETRGPEWLFPSMWRVLPNAATVDNPTRVSAYGRWANVYPPNRRRAAVSWHSLKSPAALPLTSENFPSTRTLKAHYKFQFYDVAIDPEIMDMPSVLDEMIGQRLLMGFQIAVGSRVRAVEASLAGGSPHSVFASPPPLARDCIGLRIYLTRTGLIHRLAADDDHTINVRLYSYDGFNVDTLRTPSLSTALTKVKTKYDDAYNVVNSHFWKRPAEHMNWSMLDQQSSGADDVLENLHSSGNSYLVGLRYVLIPVACAPRPGLTQEEIHVEGVTKFVRAVQKKCGDSSFHVHYYTGTLHAAVNDMLLDAQNRLVQNRLSTSISLKALASEMQGKLGLNMRDRRWHFTQYRKVFTGAEFARWLLKTFSDIDNIVQATDYAQSLMDKGLFRHPESRHEFINGHYFYEMTEEYRIDSEVSSNPQTQHNKVHVSESFIVNAGPNSDARSERVRISIDRLHNPKNTFHVLVEWLNATPKLVDDLFSSYARLVAAYGLRLVQVAVADVQGSIEDSPFKTVVNTECCLAESKEMDSKQFLHYVLRESEYVLDIHDRDEIGEYDALFMWGRVHSVYSQYIHSSGYVLAQLTGGMGIRITPNTLYVSRAVMMGQPAESECEKHVNSLRQLLVDADRMLELKRRFMAKRAVGA